MCQVQFLSTRNPLLPPPTHTPTPSPELRITCSVAADRSSNTVSLFCAHSRPFSVLKTHSDFSVSHSKLGHLSTLVVEAGRCQKFKARLNYTVSSSFSRVHRVRSCLKTQMWGWREMSSFWPMEIWCLGKLSHICHTV